MKKSSYKFLAALCLIVPAFVFSSCKKNEKPKINEPNKMWAKFLSGHSTGVISRRSKIQIQFALDVFAPDLVGKDGSKYIDVRPAIDGEVIIADVRQLVIIPKKDLKQGEYYVAKIKVQQFPSLPNDIGDYEFIFQIIKQAFEVQIEGLTINPADDKLMELKGTMLSADVESADIVEKVVEAKIDGTALPLTWIHDVSGLKHEFMVTGIQRKDVAQTLKLSWDGKVIDVDTHGSQNIEVPSLTVFKVTDALGIQEAQQYIQVYFSDNLDSQQNLKGLIQLGQNRFTARVDGSTIKIFPESRFVGKLTVTINGAIKNSRGNKLETPFSKTIVFTSEKPGVRFVGKGVILPSNDILKIPFESMNVHSVQVTVFKVFENNMGQFLQVNKLDGTDELARVGRFLWRKTIHMSALDFDKWQRYDLDVSQLAKENPGAILRITLSINRSNSSYSCSEEENKLAVVSEDPLANNEDLYVRETSSWDYSEDYYGQNDNHQQWNDRDDPCKDAYYKYHEGVSESKNFLASNIGLLAKKGQTNTWSVVATDLQTAEPLSGVQLSLMNFQNQPMATAISDGDGFAEFNIDATPFYVQAIKNKDVGFLKVNSGSALSVSHFDVGGEQAQSGAKGFIYGERGVWRPGDDIHLVFVLEDKNNVIPGDHPVTMNLYNPQGQLIESKTNTQPVNDFYVFKMKTEENAPTGNWLAKAQLGNRVFTKKIKIETVIPNRLKIELNAGGDILHQSEMPLKTTLSSQWLHGAKASGLKADVKVSLEPLTTKFDRYGDFMFDDMTRKSHMEDAEVFSGNLDAEGKTTFNLSMNWDAQVSGMMNAQFTTRVFEQGGAFSISRQNAVMHPFENYVGIKIPKGDRARNMLLTDKKHTLEVASIDSHGNPVSLSKVRVSFYKINWRWWWDKNSDDGLANFAQSSETSRIDEQVITTKNGQGQFEFEVKYPAWGRYLLRACDEEGGHCASKDLYIDWPGWAGRAQEEGGPGVNVLQIFSDKNEYTVGEKAIVELPEASQGRALVSLENGSRIIEQRWVELKKGKPTITVPITSRMSPNVYVSVTMLQAHKEKQNDRPIRMYGVIPLLVKDPATVLEPVVQAADEWAPETNVHVSVSESRGHSMTYTLAVVDEGLLGLTNFKTPNLHQHFYRKEALGISTWDLFDFVVGAYGGDLDRLLALGGDGDMAGEESETERRFPPVVRFYGPFKLDSRKTNKHEIDIPAYVGAVRVMVVAADNGAYGQADKTVVVKEDLTMLVTLPRMVSPAEKITVPVAVFVSKPEIKEVSVFIKTDPMFQVLGLAERKVPFSKPGEQMAFFDLQVSSRIGRGTIEVFGVSGSAKSNTRTTLEIRSPNPSITKTVTKILEANQSVTERIEPFGLEGTNQISFELSSIPPLNLEKRLQYLIQYPHGCVEQVTSSVFPQLYLDGMVSLNDQAKQDIEKNVTAGIDRLKGFQVPNGGFVYWPGGYGSGGEGPNPWATNYVGHFLLEAKSKGYLIPPAMLSDWTNFQKSHAQAWTNSDGGDALTQAYRLYVLALAGDPELGAMNRLRELKSLPNVAKWQLAAAYQLAGQSEAAQELAKADTSIVSYLMPDNTFGSDLRDQAIILNSMAILSAYERGKSLSELISTKLSENSWYSTQSTAYTLMAMAKFFGVSGAFSSFDFSYAVGSGDQKKANSTTSVIHVPLVGFPFNGDQVTLQNQSSRRLIATFVSKGIPPAGLEKASSQGLSMSVQYTDVKANPIDRTQLIQGADVMANVKVKNLTAHKIDNIALTHLAASGWEIHNQRFDLQSMAGNLDYQDIRDDRILSYFGLKAGEEISIPAKFNAAYLGRFYSPGLHVEAMYDATKSASTEGAWCNVTSSKK